MKRIATVTCLASYRAARHAVRVLVGLLHDPPWLAGVRVELVGKDPVIVGRVDTVNDRILCCLPRHVNLVRVEPRLARTDR